MFSRHFLRPNLFEVLWSPTESPKTFVWISGVPKFVPPTLPASLLQLRSSPLCSRKLGFHVRSRYLPLPGVVTTGLPASSGAHYSTYSVRPSSKACLALRPPAPCLCLNADRICILHYKRLQLVTPYPYSSYCRDLTSICPERESKGQLEGNGSGSRQPNC